MGCGTPDLTSIAIDDRKPVLFRDRRPQTRPGDEGEAMESTFAALTPVQRASLVGLQLRALDAGCATPILNDTVSVEIAEALGLDLARPRLPRSVVAVHAVRAKTLDTVIRRFVTRYPGAVVLDLGCGLDPRMQRCAPPATVDWYGVDHPAVARLREQFLPHGGHVVGVDVVSSDWLAGLPRDRPTVVVTDGLMAFLTGAEFIAMTRAVTTHFETGEFAFNAYSRLAMRNSRRMRGGALLSAPTAGEGIDDPHEPETWQARLSLIEELSMTRAPEVALYPPLLRALARLSARSARLVRAGDRVVRYRFPVT
jgi:O-methyltransferase involved in polyketide biosynthesis